MDDKQLNELIEKIVFQIKKEILNDCTLPCAYIVLPLNWTEEKDKYVGLINTLKESYSLIAVIPDGEDDSDLISAIGPGNIEIRSKANLRQGNIVTFFPKVSHSLVAKVALCISDDFESKWISNCILNGQQVFMDTQSNYLTGKEPSKYRSKLESYYRDIKAYGIKLEIDQLAQSDIRDKTTTSFSSSKKKIITVKDVENMCGSQQIILRHGDIITALADEYASDKGISIIYK